MIANADSPQSSSAGSTGVIAFFDLDGTLVRGQTQVLLVRFMRKNGAVSLAFLLGVGLWFLAYQLGLAKLTRQARERGAAMFKGLTPEEVERAMSRFAEDVLAPRLHPRVVEALEGHKARGERVVVLSAALDPVVRALCRYVRSDDCVGAVCQTRDGRYTGRIDGPIPHASEKMHVAASFMSRFGAVPSDCWAYGDHDTDLALLRWVGHPVAVNPRPGLLAEARRAGWPVIA